MKKKWIGALALGAMLATAPTAALAETVTIDLGNPLISVDAGNYEMQEVAGVSEDGIILVPVRDVAEAFGGTVVYEEAQNMVKMTFPNGQWATIEVIAPADEYVAKGEEGIVNTGTFINDKLYLPADLMAACLGGRLEFIDYGHTEVFRLIYHVR